MMVASVKATAVAQSGDQNQGESFFRRAVNDLVILEKPRMN
jgi:hypothetical protein